MKFILPHILSKIAGKDIPESLIEGRMLPALYTAHPDKPLRLAYSDKAELRGRATVFYIAPENVFDFDGFDIDDNDDLSLLDYSPRDDDTIKITEQGYGSMKMGGFFSPEEGQQLEERYLFLKIEEGDEVEGLLFSFKGCTDEDHSIQSLDSDDLEIVSIPDLTPDLEMKIKQGIKIAEFNSLVQVTDSIKDRDRYIDRALKHPDNKSGYFREHIMNTFFPTDHLDDIYKVISMPSEIPVIDGIYDSVSYLFVDDAPFFTAITDGEEEQMEKGFFLLEDELTRFAYKERYQKGVVSGQILSQQLKEKLTIGDVS